MTGREEAHEKIRMRNLKILARIEESLGKNNYLSQFYNVMTARNYSEKTKRLYLDAVIHFIEYMYGTQNVNGKETILYPKNASFFNTIKYADIINYVVKLQRKPNGKPNSVSYQTNQIKGIKAFFRLLLANRDIDNNPAENIEYPKDETGEKQIVFLSEKEVQAIKELVSSGLLNKEGQWQERDKAIIMLFLRTGIRCSEMSELNIEDVDLEKKEIHILGKGNKNRTIPLGREMVDDLKCWLELRSEILYNKGKSTEAVFISNRLTRISCKTLERMTHKYVECGTGRRKIGPHKLRSTFATHMLEKTGDMTSVGELLGHANLATTRIYARPTARMTRNAINQLDW